MKILTDTDLVSLIENRFEEGAPDVLGLIRRWVDRGDGAAIYENAELDNPGLGELKIVSYGSPTAQLEVAVPPTTLPDIGGAINWRFQLKAIHGGPAVTS